MRVSDDIPGNEPYLLVEEVADRLGLPLAVLMHRVEAGDIPSRRVETDDGVHYALRLGDLGIELDDDGMRAAAIDEDETTLTTAFEPPAPEPAMRPRPDDDGVESAIASAFESGPPTRYGAAPEASSEQPAGAGATEWSRPREPRQPPPWMLSEERRQAAAEAEAAGDGGSADGEGELAALAAETERDDPAAVEGGEGEAPVPADEPAPPASAFAERSEPPLFTLGGGEDDGGHLPGATPEDDLDDGIPALVHAADVPDEELDPDSAIAELAVPPPSRRPVGLLDTGGHTPRGDLASMSLDARELVAGLLDRWERTLEQRIYTEQRQRFQTELVSRQNMVKQLQMELHTARAEHAAAQADKDRMLAAKERELADRERDLAETRRSVEETQQRLAAPSRRRRWFRGRDD